MLTNMVAFYEILNGLWVRNGLQIKGQAMTYIQCNFCNSMVDSDFYLLQICATQLPAETFLQTVIDKFHVNDWLSFSSSSSGNSSGVNSTLLSQLEMVTLLCMGDKTHSQLMELMPERCGTAQSRDFELRLAEVADYRAPNLEASGNMQQGMYVPKAAVWERVYDPLHVLLRAVHRRDFQTSMDRYAEHVHQTGKLAATKAPWPPYRHPAAIHSAYLDPRRVLCSRVFHALAWTILYKAVTTHTVPEHVMSLIIYLLEMCIVCSATTSDNVNVNDLEFSSFFESDWLSNNLRTTVNTITLSPEPAVVINTSDSEGDFFDQFLSSALELDLPALMPALTPPHDETTGEASSDANSTHQPEASSIQAAIMEGLQSVPNHSSLLVSAAQLSVIRHAMNQSTAAIGQSSTQATPTTRAAIGPGAESSQATPTLQAGPADMQLMPTNPNRALELGGNGGGGNAGQDTGGAYSRLAALPSTSGASAAEFGTTSSAVVHCPSVRCQASSGAGKRNPKNRMLNQFSSDSATPPERTVKANESIISLLLKLHSHLSGIPDSFNPDETDPDPDSRIGDGPVFVGKLLRRIMALDSLCRENVVAVRERLWPRQPEEGEAERRDREERERGERRRRAKERQQKLMEEFASQQKQFMEKTLETEDDGMDWEAGDESSQMLSNKKEYDCVICNQTSPSTDEKLMGLAVLVQATSVLGHKRRSAEPAVLPTSDQERANFSRNDTLGSDFDRRIEEIDRHFDKLSWLVSVNLGWEGGVHVQTCGHHLHLDCLKSYLRSLLGQQRISAERLGEYSCPFVSCQPPSLPSQLGDNAAVVRSRPASLSASIAELTNFLKENLPANQWPAWETWQQLAGSGSTHDESPALIPAEPPMPLMLRDPTALLTQFILLLPLHLDQTSFSTVVKLLYNLSTFKCCSTELHNERTTALLVATAEVRTPCTSEHAMSLVIGALDPNSPVCRRGGGGGG
ncbi:hypothetical protein LSTR_LSTR013279 [Laodelphax striatellus]|uniref:E3 ubiquitin-protein ligase n=1 Tax=Laodelphax striatellus TaxID=195883 RepID=A0A482WI29_LAOST|nr:hypothetical protein LSTR_LSTR013279 [Laodelphax striatellus]